MKSFPRFTPFFLLALCTPFAVLAQEKTTVELGARAATFETQLSLQSSPTIGLPVSYERVFDSSRVLADGTRITDKTQTSYFYRDSSGRTRTERPMFEGFAPDQKLPKVPLIEICDPVAGVQYVLDTVNRVAYRFPLSTASSRVSSPEASSSSPQAKSTSDTSDDSASPQKTTESLGMQIMEGVSSRVTESRLCFPPAPWAMIARLPTRLSIGTLPSCTTMSFTNTPARSTAITPLD